MRRFVAALLLWLLPLPAFAAWFRATSDHFIVYGEGSEASVRAYAERLERFEAVLAAQTGLRTERGANPLIVFLVGNPADVRKQIGDDSGVVAGVYDARLWGTFAIVPRRSGSGSRFDLDSQTILFHEYTHHFMLRNAAVAYPAWYVEGFAEFFSTVKLAPDGSVSVGYPATHRSLGLAFLPRYPLKRLLDPEDRPMYSIEAEAFYGWSWLLTHYLHFSKTRRTQLDSYLRAYAAGKPSLDAATEAFGSLDQLQTELIAYRNGERYQLWKVRNIAAASPAIVMAALSPSEGAAMPLLMRSYRASTSKQEVDAAVIGARKVAAKVPGEPMALDVLAEFELDAGQVDAAQRANDAVLAVRPADPRALMRSARIAEARLDGKGTDAQWKAIRSLIVKANRAAPNDPFPLWAYYRWHRQAGVSPDKTAVDGLRRALQLAPQVSDLRFMLASHEYGEGNEASARRVLAPLVNDPHNAALRKAAQAMIDSKGKERPQDDMIKPKAPAQ